jgi:16S rRNA (cytidine1402-2'-O)-methyltransferase
LKPDPNQLGGLLYLVPTPIGNLEDITMRSLRILREEATILLAEDTRTTRKLLDHYGINRPLRAFHAFNEHRAVTQVVQELESGAIVALMSDAGTPGISDPGFLLVRAARQAGIRVVCLPGATALIPAVAASGLPSDSFFYEGFLPHKKGRQTRLRYLSTLTTTFVLYESPHRLLRCLQELLEHCGAERIACVARELSKMHESVITQSLSDLIAHYTAHPDQVRGEVVIVVAGAEGK